MRRSAFFDSQSADLLCQFGTTIVRDNDEQTIYAMRRHIIYYNLYSAVLIGIASIWLTGCKTTRAITESPIDTPHADTTLLPGFPSEMLYVLGKEWEAVYDTSSAKYNTARAIQLRKDSAGMGEYIEERLRELYPEKAYKGYVRKIESICQEILRQYPAKFSISNNMQEELPDTGFSEVTESNALQQADIGTDSIEEEECFSMEFTPREAIQLETLNHLANQEEWVTRNSFDTLHISEFEEENLLLSVMLWSGPKMFYRIIQSKSRAEKLAQYYYGEETHNGKPGDAFKHIYVNVLLRRYTNSMTAWLVMDMYWENAHKNAPCDHYMDLHNNIIGRNTRYHEFVNADSATACSNAREWLLWAERVPQFVQDSTNGELQPWNKETPTFIVEPAAQRTEKIHYIYWDR